MARAQMGRPLDGVFLLDKPRGLTSNRVLQIIRRAFRAQKAGHTGSLDPLATGMLPICFGSATRLSQYLLDARKTYRVRCTVGVATDTGDADGRVIATGPVPGLPLDGIRAHLQKFLGVADQVPPMYSALKHQGRRLYAIARQGQTVTRVARRITVYSIDDVQLAWPDLEFTVVCSKGTYIRSLAEDIAEALGTVGHVSALRRLAVGPFASDEMVSLEQVQTVATADPTALDQWLLPMDRALPGWASVDVPAPEAARLRQGQTIGVAPTWPIGQVKLYGPGGIFFGLGEVLPTGTLTPRRIFTAAPLGEAAAVRVE